jgi:hypothetical protein
VLVGYWFILAGLLLFTTTLKRPTWLGGNERRYTSEESTYAAVARAQKRTISMWLIIGGAFSAIVGV